MPGLSQLKKFNSDMLSLGNEVTVRASRGEKPVKVEIPASIPDVDDSEEFVIGMPVNEVEQEAAPAEEDFSDITGVGAPDADVSGDAGEESAPAAAPDMSDLLNMGAMAADGDGQGEESMPGLSMFEDEPEPEPEPEPEEVSIADMGLDALLAGAGFDEPEDVEEVAPEETASEPADLSDISDLADIDELGDLDDLVGNKPVPGADGLDFPNDISDLSFDDASDLPSLDGEEPAADDNLLPVDEPEPSAESEVPPAGDALQLDDLEMPSADDIVPPADDLMPPPAAADAEPAPEPEENDIPELDEAGLVTPAPAAEKEVEVSDLEDLNLDDIPDMGLDLDKSVAAANRNKKNIEEIGEYNYDDEFDLSAGFDDDEETNIHPDQKGKKPAEAKKEQPLDDALEVVDETPAAEEVEVPKTNPADIKIEDLSLDALDIDGFDMDDLGTESTEEVPPAEEDMSHASQEETPAEEVPAEEEIPSGGQEEVPAEDAPAPSTDDIFNLDDMDDFSFGNEAAPEDNQEPLSETAAQTAPDAPAPEEASLDFDLPADASDDFSTDGLDDLASSLEQAPADDALTADLPASEDFSADMPSLDDLSSEMPSTDDIPSMDDMLSTEDMPSMDDIPSTEDMPSMDDIPSTDDTPSMDDIPSTDDTPSMDDIPSTDDTPSMDDILSTDDMPSMDEMPSIDDMSSSGDIPSMDDLGAEMPSLDDLNTETPFAGDFGLDSADIPAGEGDAGIDGDTNTDSSSDELPAETFNLDDMDGFGAETPDFTDTVAEDSADFDDSDSAEAESLDDLDSSEPLETFDTTGMDDVDFGISDTDSQLDGQLDDDLSFDNDFEIPGITDVAEQKEEPVPAKAKAKAAKAEPAHSDLDTPDFSEALPSEELPPNTLSDEQYKVFLKNFSEYPLNVRLAFENFIVQDEFTDDAEFEVIEKILNKAPARQVAGMLEKMMDISIPVPRDFEHRSAEEYEAYKKSLSYQLRNRIIPGFIVGCAMLLVGIGLFNFGKNCIYKPLKANSLYKQGYALLQAEEYPQSEIKFDEAVKYRLNRNWFFNYARGYREHKQFQRAEKMYQNILMCFRHDKEAGLEYADMELDDMVNYEKAEEIVRREVLDYHINDPDGILKLGDVYLEWGTEKDPAKLELAREQYASLIQLYKPNNLYMSRMMKYFIRSDKLRQVLEVKQNFDGNPKSLAAEDWTELGGYLLEKYYGPLPASQEYLRFQIDGLRKLLLTAAHADPTNPIALYNLSKYYIFSQEYEHVEKTLQNTLKMFDASDSLKRRDIYKYIDTYRLLGEYYESNDEHVQAQEQFADGISLYAKERDSAGFEGNQQIGKLYEDMADLKYFVSAEYDDALKNYMSSVALNNDSPKIRYRIGFIQYNKDNLTEALGSFMKASDGNVKEPNLMLAMANTLSLRGDDYAAEGYYNQLVAYLDNEVADRGMVFPQVNDSDNDIVNTYLYAANNYGVTLHRLAKRTGNSSLNAKSIVQFQQSLRAWDALTRNQTSMLRLGGTNLAEQNIKYVTHNFTEYEPAIYTQIPKTLTDKERK